MVTLHSTPLPKNPSGGRTFGEFLFEALEGTIPSWAQKNRAAFVLCTLMEESGAAVKEQVKKIVKDNLSVLKKIDLPGVKVLLEVGRN